MTDDDYKAVVELMARGIAEYRCMDPAHWQDYEGDATAALSALGLRELVEALELIAEYDVPRDRADIYRDDGRPSKHDRCEHGAWFYDECADCMAKCARAALAAQEKGNE